jgi:hypothetical protein
MARDTMARFGLKGEGRGQNGRIDRDGSKKAETHENTTNKGTKRQRNGSEKIDRKAGKRRTTSSHSLIWSSLSAFNWSSSNCQCVNYCFECVWVLFFWGGKGGS